MQFDWTGILTGAPLEWLKTGIVTTLVVTVVGSLLAALLTLGLLSLRLAGQKSLRALAVGITELFRNTPILVQILFWYFGAYNLLPRGWRDWINDDHPWATLPGNVPLLSPEFIASAWGLGLFTAVFVTEEIRAGLAAVSPGQSEAALSQGFSRWQTLRHVLLPQALSNAFQPVVGQFLNLMKLSSLATAIGLWEITYQVRQIESYNSHALEAFAAGTLLYLTIGLIMGRALLLLDPAKRRPLTPAPQPVEVRDAV
jgi:polar amino acid transport system permease protein